MASVTVERLTKTWPDGTVANDDVSLEIASGELMVLVGPSGCGKSTLLRMIAGLESPTSGELRIGGLDVLPLEPRQRDVAMVFQNYALYPHMTVRQNLAFPLKMARVARSRIRERVASVAATLGLEDLLERKPRALSGGQMQRVALGRALVRDPKVFLFDEPLSNVDAKLRASMRAELKALHQGLGTTMIYVTHDQVEAMTLGTRIAILHEGRLQQVGVPLEVYDRPANRFVASFMGSPPMNILDGAAADRLRPRGAPEACSVGFRAEAAEEGSGLRGRVELVEILGASCLVHLDLEGETAIVVLPADVAPAPGRDLDFRVPQAALHLFDQRTGERLGPETR